MRILNFGHFHRERKIPLRSWKRKELHGIEICHSRWPEMAVRRWQATAWPSATTTAKGGIPRRAKLLPSYSAASESITPVRVAAWTRLHTNQPWSCSIGKRERKRTTRERERREDKLRERERKLWRSLLLPTWRAKSPHMGLSTLFFFFLKKKI